LAPGPDPLHRRRHPLGRSVRGLQLAGRRLVPPRGRGLARRRATGPLHHSLRRPAGQRPGPAVLNLGSPVVEPLASGPAGRPVRGPFPYLVPPELEGRLQRGQRVLVPFGRGRALGFYLGPGRAPEGGGPLKPVSALLEDTPALPDDVLALVEFAAAYYRHPLGEALRAALPPGLADPAECPEPSPQVVRTLAVLGAPSVVALRRAPAQAATLGYLLAVGGRAELDELGRAVPGARAAVQRLVERGWVRVEERAVEPTVAEG